MTRKRLISALLALVFVLNIALAVEAKAEASDMNSVKNVEAITTGEDAPQALKNVAVMKKSRAISSESEPFNVKSMLYDSYSDPAYTTYYFDQNENWQIIPVTPEHTGCLYLDLNVYGNTSDLMGIYVVDSFKEDGEGGIYDIEYRMKENGYYTGWEAYGQQGSAYLYLPATKGETFWLLVQTAEDNTANMKMDIRARVFTTKQRTVKQASDNWLTVSGVNTDGEVNTTWFKVKPTKTGVLSFKLKEFGNSVSDGYVRLYNIDKEAVSNTVTYSTADDVSRAFFGVKKGRTYYVKVTNCGGSEEQYYKYGVKFTVTERTDRALGSKSDAKILKRKADSTHTLFVASTSKSTDWYKFKVSEKRETVLVLNASGIKSGSLYITVYKGDKKIGSDTVDNNSTGTYSITYGTTAGKADPGTYYVKVEKGTRASGKYTIRYKK